MASASTPSVNEPTRPYFSAHSKAKANYTSTNLRKKLVTSGISDVARLQYTPENPSEEEDNDNYYQYANPT